MTTEHPRISDVPTRREEGNRGEGTLAQCCDSGLVPEDCITSLNSEQVQLSLHVKMISYTLSSRVFAHPIVLTFGGSASCQGFGRYISYK